MIKKFSLLFTFFLMINGAMCQNPLADPIDSLIKSPSPRPFSGIILITKSDKTLYSKIQGFSDIEGTVSLKPDDKFVIGSISKQITSVLVLQQYEKGKLKLSDPIRNYLTFIPQSWDTITISNLLAHTHGIIKIEQALAFKPGSSFMYSQVGYELLAQILEKITGQTFAALAQELFKKCNMKNSFHPAILKPGELVNSFTEQSDGKLVLETKSLEGFVPAGGFVSTANDLALWNRNLFDGMLLKDSTLKLMITPQKNAVRKHPLFGETLYGYGITIDNKDSIFQLGQTGYADGFPSMNFYFPNSKTSVIVLQNVSLGDADFKKTFYYNLEILKIVRASLINL